MLNGMTLQADGKILVAGTVPNGTTGDNDFGLARLTNDTVPPANETVQLSQPTYPVQEPVAGPTPIQVVVDRTGGTTGTVDVPFQVTDGTAKAGTDYTVVTTGDLLEFRPGDQQATITINILPDASAAGDGSFTVALGTPTSPDGTIVSAGAPATATVTILQPETFIVSGPGSVGHNGGAATFTVTRQGPADGTATVQYSISGSVLSAGEYQGPTSGTLTIRAGQSTSTISLPISNNGQFVGNQSLTVALTRVSLEGSTNAASIGAPSSATTSVVETNSPPPPPHRDISAELVPVGRGKKRKMMVEVFYADNGALKTEFLSPLQPPAFSGLQVLPVQGNNAGAPDEVILKGRKAHRTVSLEFLV
jgi:hypothetical protein